MSRKMPRKGDIYRHFKGKKYRIIDLAVCTETGEDMVIFESADENRRVYASFLESFLSALDTGKYPHVGHWLRDILPRLFDFLKPYGFWVNIISIQPWHRLLLMSPSFFQLHLWQRLLLRSWVQIQPMLWLRPIPDL